MEPIQYTFQRVEKKYLLTTAQEALLLDRFEPHMAPDAYGRYTIMNIYYDTPDFALIRASLEKPIYKEKFRLRSYGVPGETDTIFAEIKKKYKGVVYKRRIAGRPAEIDAFLEGAVLPHEDAQIQRELAWFLQAYPLRPQAFIGYERIALAARDGSGLRITFDHSIRWRTEHLDLRAGDEGRLVLADNPVVMEIKFPQSSPLWLARLLSDEGIFPSSFSKYGECFMLHLRDQVTPKGSLCHA